MHQASRLLTCVQVDRVIVLGDDRLFNQLDIHFRQQVMNR